MANTIMRKLFTLAGILFLGTLVTDKSLGQRASRRALKFPLPLDVSDSIEQRLFALPFGDPSKFIFRHSDEERREVEQQQAAPLCEEERISQNIRELIHSSSSNFLQTSTNLDLRKYNLIPRKVDVIKCVSEPTGEKSGAVCKPENCRERKVDIEVFGRLKNETGNIWEFVGTLSAVPIACECFVRWKPGKCVRSMDVFSDY